MSSITPAEADRGFQSRRGASPREIRSQFVGGMYLTLSQGFRRVARNNVFNWFEGANTHYVHSARTAIERAVSLLGLGAGDEVLVPAYHCGSELDVLLKAGAQVQLFRISAAGELDFEDLESRFTEKTRAVYVIHYFGFPQKLEPVAELCRRRNCYLVEDCALSLFTEVDGRRLGSVGDLAIYNFPKMLPVPDGGALVVNRPELQRPCWSLRPASLPRVLRNLIVLFRQGLLRKLPNTAIRSLFKRFRTPTLPPGSRGDTRLEIPESYYFSSALSDRSLSQPSSCLMRRMDVAQIRDRRRRNYSRLLKKISHVSNLKPLFSELPTGVCPLSLPVLVHNPRELAQKLQARSIPAIAWWSGYHRFFPAAGDLHEARFLKDSIVALPIHQQLDDQAVDFIGNTILECFA